MKYVFDIFIYFEFVAFRNLIKRFVHLREVIPNAWTNFVNEILFCFRQIKSCFKLKILSSDF